LVTLVIYWGTFQSCFKQTFKETINKSYSITLTNLMYHPLKDVHIPVTKTSLLRSQVNLKKMTKKWIKKKIPSEIKPSLTSDNSPPIIPSHPQENGKK
jgi:hypothetical protein